MKLQEERNKRFDEKFVLNIPNRSVTGRDKKIKSFLQSEIDMALAQFIDQEIERKNGMRKEIPPYGNLSQLRINCAYNECLDEDISHLISLKEQIKWKNIGQQKKVKK